VREDVPAAVDEIRRLSEVPCPVFLVGHSLGGLIAYAAAPALGSSVAGVVTLGSPYHFTRGSRFLSFVGSTMLTLDRALQNVVALGVPLASALRMVTANPARQIGLGSRKGVLAAGADADLVFLDDKLEISGVMTRGAGLDLS
jgi:alpha-beta hydrolase superfamily lysophospholipase